MIYRKIHHCQIRRNSGSHGALLKDVIVKTVHKTIDPTSKVSITRVETLYVEVCKGWKEFFQVVTFMSVRTVLQLLNGTKVLKVKLCDTLGPLRYRIMRSWIGFHSGTPWLKNLTTGTSSLRFRNFGWTVLVNERDISDLSRVFSQKLICRFCESWQDPQDPKIASLTKMQRCVYQDHNVW